MAVIQLPYRLSFTSSFRRCIFACFYGPTGTNRSTRQFSLLQNLRNSYGVLTTMRSRIPCWRLWIVSTMPFCYRMALGMQLSLPSRDASSPTFLPREGCDLQMVHQLVQSSWLEERTERSFSSVTSPLSLHWWQIEWRSENCVRKELESVFARLESNLWNTLELVGWYRCSMNTLGMSGYSQGSIRRFQIMRHPLPYLLKDGSSMMFSFW